MFVCLPRRALALGCHACLASVSYCGSSQAAGPCRGSVPKPTGCWSGGAQPQRTTWASSQLLVSDLGAGTHSLAQALWYRPPSLPKCLPLS